MSAPDSSRLLKAESLRGRGSQIAFNYDDLRQHCDTHIESVRRQARELIAAAHQEAESIRHAAHEQGQADGRRQGVEQAEQEIEARLNTLAEEKSAGYLQTALPALREAAAALSIERDRWLAHWQTAAVRLSVAIAEKIVRQELASRPNLAAEMVRNALQLAAGNPQIKLRLHPDDIQLFGRQCEEILGSLSAGGNGTLFEDPKVSRGGCVVETQHGVIDAQLETQLARIAAELLEEG